jgi:glycerol-3-phosphate dehydrogenase
MDLNVLVVGGGIHGVGVLHDLASRGIAGLHLVERRQLASGTSSRTTKLIHGGLRYLEHPLQWGLVREALRERARLLELLPGIVKPLPFVVPLMRSRRPAWLLGTGLWLYDRFAADPHLPRSRRLTTDELRRLAPFLGTINQGRDPSAYLYYDAQMLDDVIVRLVARAATRLGATYAEHSEVQSVRPVTGGFRVQLRASDSEQELSCRQIINAGGAWTTANLLRWGFVPRVICLLNVGSHLVLEPSVVAAEPARCAATLLQHDDGRVVFFIPWDGKWLLGTTDTPLEGSPEQWRCPSGDRAYLLEFAARHLLLEGPETAVQEWFCGIRTVPLGRWRTRQWLRPADDLMDSWRRQPFESPWYRRHISRGMAALSREALVDDSIPGLLSIYGGKFTTYRSLSERVGDRIARRLGVVKASGTGNRYNWFLDDLPTSSPLLQSYPVLRSG